MQREGCFWQLGSLRKRPGRGFCIAGTAAAAAEILTVFQALFIGWFYDLVRILVFRVYWVTVGLAYSLFESFWGLVLALL